MKNINDTEKGQSLKELLVIDDEENMRHMLAALLGKSGYSVDTAGDGNEGLQMLSQKDYAFILCDIKMPGMDGMEFLKSMRDRLGSATVIMMSAYGTLETAVEAMKLGAYDYISKPFKTDEVLLSLKKAEEREILKQENTLLKERIENIKENYSFGNMVAKSKSMLSLFSLAQKATKYSTTVLITGESGTGKELIAKGIHFGSERSDKPLVTVNCGGIPENLLESELFGYKKGAFTGADKNKKGLFEEADGGTIFLDEIGELPMVLQVKLLRVLQENEIRPVGDSKTKKIDSRVIAATSKNLESEIKKGNFREDLFYRLNVLPIRIPPLRERVEDISILSQYFVKRFNRELERAISEISPVTLSVLVSYKWPGNVRELENAVERAFLLSEESELLPEHFSLGPVVDEGEEYEGELSGGFSIKLAQKALEKKLIHKALMETNGNRTKAARLLEISHPSLLSKIKTYDIRI